MHPHLKHDNCTQFSIKGINKWINMEFTFWTFTFSFSTLYTTKSQATLLNVKNRAFGSASVCNIKLLFGWVNAGCS